MLTNLKGHRSWNAGTFNANADKVRPRHSKCCKQEPTLEQNENPKVADPMRRKPNLMGISSYTMKFIQVSDGQQKWECS